MLTIFLKIYFKRIPLYGAVIWTTVRREDRKIQAMKMIFLRTILNKTEKDRIKNINIKLELWWMKLKMTFKQADLDGLDM